MTTTTPELAPWPTGRANRDTILAQFGEGRTDLMQWALTTGDPLADAVVTEMHELGMSRARPLVTQGFQHGLASLTDPPPALAALLTQTETAPDYLDDELLDELPLPYFSSPAPVHMVSLAAGSLIRVYNSPSIAKVLTTTGRLLEGANRRLRETGNWQQRVMQPGSLRVGQPGYVAALELRMLHAHMRKLAADRHFDTARYGTPINQVDLGRTWMDYTLTSYTAEDSFGFGMSTLETAGLYKYWWYLAHLIGIDARLVQGITDSHAAARLDAAFQAVTGPLIPESVELAEAGLSVVTATVKELLGVPENLGRPVLNAITRRIHGDATCQDLGVPDEPVADLWLRPVIAGLRATRERRRRNPGAWQAAIDKNLTDARTQVAADDQPTAFQRGATAADD